MTPAASANPAAAASASRAPAEPFVRRGGRRVRAALERQIDAAGLGARIGGQERTALLAALADVRRSARRAQRRTRTDAEADAAHARTVVEADRLFRETLGVGIAGFVAAQGPPGRIEDLGAVDVTAAAASRER